MIWNEKKHVHNQISISWANKIITSRNLLPRKLYCFLFIEKSLGATKRIHINFYNISNMLDRLWEEFHKMILSWVVVCWLFGKINIIEVTGLNITDIMRYMKYGGMSKGEDTKKNCLDVRSPNSIVFLHIMFREQIVNDYFFSSSQNLKVSHVQNFGTTFWVAMSKLKLWQYLHFASPCIDIYVTANHVTLGLTLNWTK